VTSGVRYTGVSGLRIVNAKLRDIPRELRSTIRPRLVAAGEMLRAAAASEASWSTRIPASLRVTAKFAGARAGVFVIASQRKAPHARALEGISGNSQFRHPVFGDEEDWVSQATRPFLSAALARHGDDAVDAVTDAIDEAMLTEGFH